MATPADAVSPVTTPTPAPSLPATSAVPGSKSSFGSANNLQDFTPGITVSLFLTAVQMMNLPGSGADGEEGGPDTCTNEQRGLIIAGLVLFSLIVFLSAFFPANEDHPIFGSKAKYMQDPLTYKPMNVPDRFNFVRVPRSVFFYLRGTLSSMAFLALTLLRKDVLLCTFRSTDPNTVLHQVLPIFVFVVVEFVEFAMNAVLKNSKAREKRQGALPQWKASF